MGKSKEEGHNNMTDDEKRQVAAWTIEDKIYEMFKTYLSLDSYGQSAVDALIRSENRRCIEQQTSLDTSDYNIQITVNKDAIDV